MHEEPEIVEWRARERVLPPGDTEEFFDQPLLRTTVFRYETERFAVPPHRSHFSLKFSLAGSEFYAFGNRKFALVPGHVLCANEGAVHSSRVAARAQCLSIFATTRDARLAARLAMESHASLLDAPDDAGAAPDAAQTPAPLAVNAAAALQRMATALDGQNSDEIDDALADLLPQALAAAYRIAPPSALRHIKKRSTRDELAARALRARTWIDDMGGADYDLDRLADVSRLSQYHLHRVFADIYGCAPAAYARNLRLDRARQAIQKGEPMMRVARRAGFRSVKRFKDAMRKRFGASAGRNS